ncbi:MAG TPA: putative lipid II flippase FtsW [Acidimicrobiia bacterium]|nr:putative lipid II flippase FtsW [Acidimicrobiia bacterium]
MTTNVTSIAQARAAARSKAETSHVNGRIVSILLVVVVVLIVVGLGATLSASSISGLANAQDQYHYFKRQLLGLALGVVAMVIASRLDYRLYRKLAIPIFGMTLAVLILVLFVGLEEGGSRRWLAVGPLTVQPSEVAKLSVILTLAVLLERKQRLLHEWKHFLGPVLFCVGLTAMLVILERDLGTTIVIGVAGLAVILVSRTPIRFVLTLAVMAVVAAIGLAMVEGYRMDRIDGFIDPWADPQGTGYQLIQGYYALGTGGVFGVGLGASRARWSYLPNAHTDFIFAIIGEETGLVGAMMVIALCLCLALVGWLIATRAPDRFGRMIAAGIIAWLSAQALVNVGGVLGLIPITGIVLPFVSYGSTAMIVSLAAIGVLVNIAQHGTPHAEP